MVEINAAQIAEFTKLGKQKRKA